MPGVARVQQRPQALSGTYILLLRLARGQSFEIGRLGERALPRGWYLYVGSAFGPGGVAARCNHHRRISPSPRWHIDYLRAVAPLRAIWFSHAASPLEHSWAQLLAGDLRLRTPIIGFGASDCGCPSHLFHLPVMPDLRHFSRLLVSQSQHDYPVHCEKV
jgi:Uri superfamily endonuclease